LRRAPPRWRESTINLRLLLVVECDGDTLLAYVGIMRALNTRKPTDPAPPRRKAAKRYRVL
jgi:hypothetical protein